MSTRDSILQAVDQNKPPSIALPEIDTTSVIAYDDVLAQYKTVLENIGGKWQQVNDESELDELIKQECEGKKLVINILATSPGDLAKMDAASLAEVDLAIIKGTIAVAENGAIWISEDQMKSRLLPFICQQLIFIIRASDIVSTMHQAYRQIDIRETGFGVFVAGPSKTADIEQSLVIGAHGPVGLKVLIVAGK